MKSAAEILEKIYKDELPGYDLIDHPNSKDRMIRAMKEYAMQFIEYPYCENCKHCYLTWKDDICKNCDTGKTEPMHNNFELP